MIKTHTFKHFHAKRLLKLANYLDTVKNENFTIDVFSNCYNKEQLTNHTCGSIACAVGYMGAVFPRVIEYRLCSVIYRKPEDMVVALEYCLEIGLNPFCNEQRMSAHFFNLNDQEWCSLFMQRGYSCYVTPKHVANKIREFVAAKLAG